MTRAKGANDSRPRRTQRKRDGTWCPPPPPRPGEDLFEPPNMPLPPPPPPPPPMPHAAPGAHRPPPGFGRAAEGGRPWPFKRPHSPLGRGRRHGECDECEQLRRNVRYRGDWDGRGAGGGPPGPLRAGPRGGGDNDGWQRPSPPRPLSGGPPRPIRGPPLSPNHFGGGARRPPAGGPPGPPRLPPHPPFRGRVYRSWSPSRLPRPPLPGAPPSPQRVPPPFRGGRDNYRPRSPPRQPWGPPSGPPRGDWRSPRGDGWDRPRTLPRRPAGPPTGWTWAPSCAAWGENQVPPWEVARPAPLWRVPDTHSPWRVAQYGDLGDTQEFQWVLTQTPTRNKSSPWTWWPAPSQPMRQPTSAEPPSRPVYVLQGSHPSVDPTYQLVPVSLRPPQLLPPHPPPPHRL